jgi:hypothetical protein
VSRLSSTIAYAQTSRKTPQVSGVRELDPGLRRRTAGLVQERTRVAARVCARRLQVIEDVLQGVQLLPGSLDRPAPLPRVVNCLV